MSNLLSRSKSRFLQSATMIGGKGGAIGGSLVASILNRSPFGDECDAYARLVFGSDKKDSVAMRRGRVFEPWVKQLTRDRLGLDIVEPLNQTVTTDDGVFSGSFDGLVVGDSGRPEGIIEIKTASSWGSHWNDGVPEHYGLQVSHYKWMSGFDLAYVVCLQCSPDVFEEIENEVSHSCFGQVVDMEGYLDCDDVSLVAAEIIQEKIDEGSAKFLSFRDTEPNDSYSQEVVPRLREWYQRHIVPRVPPPLTGSEGSVLIVRDLFPVWEGDRELSVDDDQDSKLIRLMKMKASMNRSVKALEAEIRRVSVEIRKGLGDNKSATMKGSDGKVLARAQIVRMNRKGRIDEEALMRDMPELCQKYMVFDSKEMAREHPDLVMGYRGEPTVSERVDVRFPKV